MKVITSTRVFSKRFCFQKVPKLIGNIWGRFKSIKKIRNLFEEKKNLLFSVDFFPWQSKADHKPELVLSSFNGGSDVKVITVQLESTSTYVFSKRFCFQKIPKLIGNIRGRFKGIKKIRNLF